MGRVGFSNSIFNTSIPSIAFGYYGPPSYEYLSNRCRFVNLIVPKLGRDVDLKKVPFALHLSQRSILPPLACPSADCEREFEQDSLKRTESI